MHLVRSRVPVPLVPFVHKDSFRLDARHAHQMVNRPGVCDHRKSCRAGPRHSVPSCFSRQPPRSPCNRTRIVYVACPWICTTHRAHARCTACSSPFAAVSRAAHPKPKGLSNQAFVCRNTGSIGGRCPEATTRGSHANAFPIVLPAHTAWHGHNGTGIPTVPWQPGCTIDEDKCPLSWPIEPRRDSF